ncbi:MAG: hypothetical protein JXR94_16960 [Candidatus Hydrogenedentes bacterium]|nr:hypothetical protein [Candidatus Hydrogenedentota bacterium]
MHTNHPKSVRRRLLLILYERYLKDPLDMLTPEDLLEDGTIRREDLLANAYYLSDRGLAEVMTGYAPPLFAAARITADGIDLVENTFEFNLRFPPSLDELEEATAGVPVLIESLLEQAEFSELDGEKRQCLLRDVLYLRDELSRPAVRWRAEVVEQVLAWIRAYFKDPESELPALAALEAAIRQARAS